MRELLYIACGGAIGAVMRFLVGGWAQRLSWGVVFPWGTLAVNLLGSLIIGVLWAIFDRFIGAPNLRLFLLVGLLGGFTTYSTFSIETLNLLRDGELRLATLYVIAHIVLGLALAAGGYLAARGLLTR